MASYKGKNAVKRWAINVTRSRVPQLKKLVTFAIWNGVTIRTPVDTGRARGNWNAQAGTPDRSNIPEPKKGEVVPAPLPPAIGELPLGVPAYITNNLPYIGPLEEGSSTQAPAGMVNITLEEVERESAGMVRAVRLQNERGSAGA